VSYQENQPYQQEPYPPMPRKSVSKQRKGTSHTFHLIMTCCTFGMWGLFVWMPLTLWHKIGPKQKVVTHYR
jgi:hypothetical protein